MDIPFQTVALITITTHYLLRTFSIVLVDLL